MPNTLSIARALLKLLQTKIMFNNSRNTFLLMRSAICFAVLLIASCNQSLKQQVEKDNIYYTCSMHPQVMEDKPGKCPICGMTLIAVSKSSAAMSNEISLNKEQIELGNIHTDTIHNGFSGNKMTLTGTLNFDQQKLTSLSSRVEGRIETLYFKNSGDYVHKGDKLYDIYSEELNNAKQEYVTDLQQNNIDSTLVNYSALVDAAKEKLLLWGMTNEQIKQLAKTKEVPTATSFYSNQDGYITQLNVREGDYIMEGAPVIELADMSTLWAEAQVYTSQLSEFDQNGTATVQIPDLGNLQISGHIDFVNPEIDPDTRINLVRVTIPNINKQLHPGMPVYVLLDNNLHASISLPVDAVLRDANGATIWIEEKPGVYSARMVKTGIDDGYSIEITSGLQPGEVVVTSGAYLINSEYIFRNGSGPMPGMKM
jgi:membrane fusion protein, copper/silver efflux system